MEASSESEPPRQAPRSLWQEIPTLQASSIRVERQEGTRSITSLLDMHPQRISRQSSVSAREVRTLQQVPHRMRRQQLAIKPLLPLLSVRKTRRSAHLAFHTRQ